MNKHLRAALVSLFFLSGFSGLIYESIWTHYLKLFLGHAAYAQTLVLVIFMGGMAIGSWASTRLLQHQRLNLLLAYAAAEGLIGILALLFHHTFVAAIDFSFNSAIPALGNALLVNSYKWLLGALLITPQSILLGATFPLMSSGFVRYTPGNHGTSIATLYFVNSLGACLGVLASGFFLVKAVGLPGTILTAGIINILVATFIWLLVTKTAAQQLSGMNPTANSDRAADHFLKIMLVAAALTGLSSFIYEIIWIRMLSLVLGSSTHSFELMLSAFILGLAIGGYLIRRRVDTGNQLLTLVYIQLAMGLLAAATILFYNSCFEFMTFLFAALQKNSEGYILFNISSHVLASMLMLPATICAGMTLPLVTKILLQHNYGERAIGYVYSMNTLGAIAGVIITIHVLLPYTGLKHSLVVGALVDILLAVWLLQALDDNDDKLWPKYCSLSALVVLGLITVFGSFNLHYMASAVFRHGYLDKPYKSIYHRDGKTASIDLTYYDEQLTIRTNGKPDAAINLGNKATQDEPTMRLIALIPASINPGIRQVANIGFGSGLTAHSILALPGIESLDIVEIEPAMVEGARFFGAATHRAYDDPRSHIHIDDAKTFFTSTQGKYDLIISEPSNPWVSGVSNLFSTEFYQHVKRHLTADGMLAQWLHSYEINDQLLGSIIMAISDNFDDYQIYMVSINDMLIVAKPKGKLGRPQAEFYSQPVLRSDLDRIQVHSIADIESRFVGDKSFFTPYLKLLGVPANSDYFPIVDQGAADSRFRNEVSEGFINKQGIYHLLHGDTVRNADITRSNYNMLAVNYQSAHDLQRRILENKSATISFGSNELIVKLFEQILDNCHMPDEWTGSALWIGHVTTPYLPAPDATAIWDRIRAQSCYAHAPAEARSWIAALRAFAARDYRGTVTALDRLAAQHQVPVATLHPHPFVLQMYFTSLLQLQDYTAMQAAWAQLPPGLEQRDDLRFLMATAVLRNKPATR